MRLIARRIALNVGLLNHPTNERSHTVRYRIFGRTGMKVSPYAVGAMTSGAIEAYSGGWSA